MTRKLISHGIQVPVLWYWKIEENLYNIVQAAITRYKRTGEHDG